MSKNAMSLGGGGASFYKDGYKNGYSDGYNNGAKSKTLSTANAAVASRLYKGGSWGNTSKTYNVASIPTSAQFALVAFSTEGTDEWGTESISWSRSNNTLTVNHGSRKCVINYTIRAYWV